ncbi:TonB-dependent receptor [Pseudoalteromonas sp. NBT06-2]|uniref:TonB-dependent receptor n=1 Tax=Pseudoalteromonas sp. NBT06-2 TaxID=2025950 RepID=UPI0020762B10|nr:TonB-dependent receptor [Pseudoalteromonas sp. NBT06-2]
MLAPAFATENEADIERILVSGDFKKENIQKLSASASVFSEQDINVRGATALDEILNGAANVNFSAGASRGRYVQIRGVGLRSQFVDPINPSVGMVIDGINYSGLGGAALLFDSSQVEIYRGPQGTRFGADALAGMVYIDTAAATFDDSFKMKLGMGNYNSSEKGVAFGTGLTNDTAFRFSAFKAESDGFMENDYLQRNDTQNRDEVVSRFKLNSQITEQLNTQLTIHYIDINNGYDGFTLDNSRHSTADNPGSDNQKSMAFGLANTYNGLDFADVVINLTSIKSDLLYSFDEDWTCNDATQPELCIAGLHPEGYSSTDAYQRDRDDYSAEVVLSGKQNNWVSGVYYQGRNVDLTREYTWFEQNFISEYDSQNIAAFGQLETKLDEQTTLITGLRVERNQGDYSDNNGINESTSDLMFGGKVALEYQVVPRTMIYTSVSRGYKAGGINGQGLASKNAFIVQEHAAFSPEYLWNAEFGVKGASEDKKLTLRVTAFYMLRDNMQLKAYIQDEKQKFIGYYDNANEGRNYGLEIETSYQLTDTLTLQGNIGYLDTKIEGYVTKEGLNQDGRDQAQAPKYQYSLNAQFDTSDNLYLNVGIEGKDAYFYSDSHNSESKNINLVNASAVYHQDDWQVSAWVRNVFDEDYAVRGFEFPNDPTDGWQTHTYEQYGEPMVTGVSFDYSF